MDHMEDAFIIFAWLANIIANRGPKSDQPKESVSDDMNSNFMLTSRQYIPGSCALNVYNYVKWSARTNNMHYIIIDGQL